MCVCVCKGERERMSESKRDSLASVTQKGKPNNTPNNFRLSRSLGNAVFGIVPNDRKWRYSKKSGI